MSNNQPAAPIDPRSDEDLVSDYLKGDNKAFSAILARYQRRLIASAYRDVNNYHAAEEIAAEALESGWKNLRSFNRNKGKFSTWIYLIAERRKNDKLRRMYKEQEIIKDLTVNRGHALIEEHNETEIDEIKEKCLSVLTEEERLLYTLKKEKELPYKDILNLPAFSGLTENDLMQRYHRLRDKITEEFKKHLTCSEPFGNTQSRRGGINESKPE